MRIALWIVQGLLAALFLFGGSVKFMMPLDEMAAQAELPGAFILFIGAVEVLGALGLVLPGITKIRPGLTPLAAAGLTIIMIGATVTTFMGIGGGTPALASIPFTVGVLAAFVAYGRSQVAPHGSRSNGSNRLATAQVAA